MNLDEAIQSILHQDSVEDVVKSLLNESDEQMRKLEQRASQGDEDAIKALKVMQRRTGKRSIVFDPRTDMPEYYGEDAINEVEQALKRSNRATFWVIPGGGITGIRKEGGRFIAYDLRWDPTKDYNERPREFWEHRSVRSAMMAIWGQSVWLTRRAKNRNKLIRGTPPQFKPLRKIDPRLGIKLYGEH